jgi:hypothetical protein
MRLAPFVVCALAATADARLMRTWHYDELYAKAEVIVIASPVSTHDREEHELLPDIQSVGPSGKASPVFARRVESTLKVVAAIKGAPGASIVLHHDREEGPPSARGPGFVQLDPKHHYLMFLVRDKDGQYVAVSGLTDPDLAIKELRQ